MPSPSKYSLLFLIVHCLAVWGQTDTALVNQWIKKSRRANSQGLYDSALVYAREGYEKAAKINYKRGEGLSLNCMGNAYTNLADYANALKTYAAAEIPLKQEADRSALSALYSNIGIVYYRKAELPRSLDYYLKALKIAEETGDKANISSALTNLGLVYRQAKDYQKAFDQYDRALKLAREIKDPGVPRIMNNIGNLFLYQKKYDEALMYYNEGLKIKEGLNDKKGIALSLCNIAIVYDEQGDLEKALHYYKAGLKISEEIKDISSCALFYGNLGTLYLTQNKPKEAEGAMLRALSLSKESEDLDGVQEWNQNLSDLYEKQGNYTKSLKHYKAFISARDSIFNEENTKKQVRSEMNFEFEKKEAVARAEQEKKDALAAADRRRQQIVLWSISGLGLLVLAFAIFAYRSFLQKRRTNREITQQKELIEEKQKEILDSIFYARRIQRSLLPPEKIIAKNLTRLKNNL